MTLQKIFGFNPQTMTVKKEVTGGVTSFLTMAYILAVNPMILTATGMSQEAVFTSTAVSAIIATLVMALYAKLPFALAPGMGLNAFFAYTVCLAMGHSWQFALTAVLIEGITKNRRVSANDFPPFHFSGYWFVHRIHRFEKCRHRS